MKQPTITRADIYTATAPPAAGLLLAMFTLHWNWLVTGVLLAATGLVLNRLRRAGWATRLGVLALLAGLLLWLWSGDGRWAVLGAFPLVFVFIRELAAVVDRRG
ncbi:MULTISPECIES: hypothetical protein [Actinopolyspora]|uniref:Uncharacterized protein n=1 Tax=Actinopolyspora saharensis TaxID=995062 RepID=A0A1H1A0I7_9ACTN|nr:MULTISPECIES: hypothetical protein [Actinopolyspora]NHD15476.1 hypothetical protein [Actinopolyspora sp. BKK2]NHE75310.1 hypothetical protein [Actinopolyspora sp. BKK1]SDQ33130.1 hypothetical protein SAMN04489718_1343 [Actinopolyspora saharensis]